MKRILIVLLAIIIFMPIGYSQLSLNHYLPPLVTGEFNSDDGARPGENEICISTPSLTSVNVNITFPGNASLDATPTISNSSPVCITLPNGFASPLLTRASESTADLDVLGNPIANLGAVISASEPVYVKYRVRSANSNQADIYTSKGTAATGTEFRTAHLLSPSTYSDRLSFVSVMALNNDTDVTINDGGMLAGVDVLGHPVNQTSISTNLNQYETKIFAVRPDNGVNSVAFIGSLISSNKDVVVVVGSMNGNMAQPDPSIGGSRDYGLDQIVPTSLVGTDYFLFKGNGTAADTLYERPIIVATSDNTDVFINGSATAYATLNAGEYTTVSDFNTDGLMYVSSSNPVYVYQPILGSSTSVATNGMFFVPPISCSAPNSVDNIPDVNGLGTATNFTGCLNILTRDLAVVTVNGVDIDLNANVGSATVLGPYTIPYLINGDAYKGFRVDGLSGDVSVNSDYDLYCGLFGYSGVAGYGGYFSGFNTPPELTTDDSCGPATLTVNSQASNTATTTFQWFKDDVLIPGVTGTTFLATEAGSYRVEETINNCDAVTSNSIIIDIPEPPVVDAAQEFCFSDDPTVGDLVATLNANGDEVLVYDVATSGTPLSSTTPLVDGATYYFSSLSITPCESARVSSTVTFSPSATVEAGVDQTVCPNLPVAVNGSIGGSANVAIWSTSGDGVFADAISLSTDYTPGAGDVLAGTVSLTLTTDNPSGACPSVSSTIVITLEDNENPLALCQDITVELDGSGNVVVDASQLDNGSSDNCGAVTIAINGSSDISFTCNDIGINSVTLTVTDANNNVSTCNSEVTVTDNTNPDALCQDFTVDLDVNGQASIVAGDVDAGSNDACGIASVSLSQTDFDCAAVGINTVTLTVIDNNGNVSTCDSEVTVADNANPDALCQDVTIDLDVNGQASIVAGDVDAGSSDNCGIASVLLSQTDFDCSTVGSNTVTLTVTDNNNNVSSCDATVTVEDNEDPEALCQDLTIELDSNGQASIVASDVDAGSSDNCGIASIVLSQTDFDCSTLGVNTVTLTVTDDNGNVSTCDSEVTVEDNEAPMLMCQDIVVELDANGQVSITADQFVVSATDNCTVGTPFFRNDPITDFTCADAGQTYTLRIRVKDQSDNKKTCEKTVTIEDNLNPDALCQDITIGLDVNGQASITAADIDAGSSDACGIASLELSQTDFDCSTVGANTVTLTVTDNNNNVSTCDATVTVEDNVAPEALCQDLTIDLDINGQASITAADVDAGSSDACGIADLSLDITDFGCANVGANTVTLTVTDNNSNESTCTATITVEDNVAPTMLCQDITVELDDNGAVSIVATDVDGGSVDACGIVTLVVDATDFDCSQVGPNTVTLTATDTNGNSASCTAIVTVEDNLPPVLECTDITINLDPGLCGAVVVYEVPVNDNCGVASDGLVSGPASGDYLDYHDSPWTVEWTATDVNGNTAGCSFTIEMFEFSNPTATLACNDLVEVALGDSGCAQIGADMILEGGPYGCYDDYIVNVEGGNAEVCCDAIGSILNVMVTDPDTGNSCWGAITIVDNVAPECVGAPTGVTFDCTEPELIANYAPAVSALFADNCGTDELVMNQVSETINGDICANGGYTITRCYVATDASGNASEACCVDIEVLRATPGAPADITLECSDPAAANGIPTADESWVPVGCMYSATASDLPIPSDCGEKVLRTWLLVDMCTNQTTTYEQLIVIQDTQAPTASASPSFTAIADATDCTSSGGLLVPGDLFVDNCGTVSVLSAFSPAGEMTLVNGRWFFPAPFVGIGSYADGVTINVTDDCGNIATFSFDLEVIDGITPTAICDEITDVNLINTAGGATAVFASTFDDGSYDNCCLDNLSVTRMDDDLPFGPSVTFTCEDAGTTVMVILRATDCYGLSNECMVEAEVSDKINPTCSAPSDVDLSCEEYTGATLEAIQSAQAGDYDAINAIFGNAIVSDNCGIANVDQTISGSLDNCGEGSFTRVWSNVSDANGNTAVGSCQQVISFSYDANSEWAVVPAIVPAIIEVACTGDVDEYAPTVESDGCELIGVSSSDQVFTVVEDACFKVIRTWTLINWCDYDPALPAVSTLGLDGKYHASNGQWVQYSQVIKVQDNTAPVVTNEDESFEVDANCEAAFTIEPKSTEECDDEVSYVITSTDLEDYQAGANGSYAGVPQGIYQVTITAEDQCGNIGAETITITVVDAKAPTAYCTDELIVTIMPSGMGSIWAKDYDLGSTDNCTEELLITFSATPEDFQDDSEMNLEFNALDPDSDIQCGSNELTVYFYDESMNQDFCVVSLIVDGVNCEGGDQPTVAGAIETEELNAVEGVMVEVNGGLFSQTTDASGMFSFALDAGGDYTVVPTLDANASNGVTTFDIVLITKHILGVQSLDSAYKQIAADANNSCSITTLDVVAIRKVILQIDADFPNNTSWRFADKNHDFAANPSICAFPEVVSFNNLDVDQLTTDFVAIKVGDVNGSAVTNAFQTSEDRTFNGAFSLDVEDIAMQAGKTYEVAFTANQAIEGMQFTMNFDANKVSFAGLGEGVAKEDNFGYALLDKGAITASWNASELYSFEGEEVFTLSLTAMQDVQLSEVLSINSRYTAAEAYSAEGLQDVALSFAGEQVQTYALYQNTPNPFKGETRIAFELPTAATATITIKDMNGNVVSVIHGDYAKGYNSVSVEGLSTTGVMYYTLKSGDFTATKKMILVE